MMAHASTVKSDAQIQQDVIRELKWDTRVEETDVGVEVDNGIVTLTGTVSSYAKRIAAEEAAHRVHGVLDVANDIEIRVLGSAGRSDTDLARTVRQVLEWHAHIPHEHIETTVSNGWVTLDGFVDYWSQCAAAERAVLRIAGVHGVVNRIAVKTRRLDPEDVRQTIEDALERRAEREARDLHVEVDDEGVVALSGFVRSWREKRAVVGAAGHAPGVRAIEDHIRVDPYI
jgi:osmotically-inducible protein OsmY